MNLNRARKGFAWVPGLAARNTREAFDDERFTAEEIVSVVRAGEAGEKLVDLCQSVGITPETYYAWKARYSGLAASQVHDLRRRTRLRKQRVTVLACALGLTAVGAGALMATRQPDVPTSAEAVAPPKANAAMPSVPQPPAATPEPPPTPQTPAAAPVTAPVVTPVAAKASPPINETRKAVAPPTSTEYFAADGYSVQVASMPDLHQARTALEKLTAAGHAAHITTKTINGVEMYRVRVGPFGTRDAAAEVAAQLSLDGYESPWLTR